MIYSYEELRTGVYAIEDGMVRMYLICGSEKALLLDTGNGSGNLIELLRKLYPGEVILAHTHAHSDHIGCDYQFEEIHANREEWKSIFESIREENHTLIDLDEGLVFNLGNRQIETKLTPGHTRGSLTFMDRENRILFTGDNISDRPVFMCLEGADINKYEDSIDWILSQETEFNVILGCHGIAEQSFDQVRKMKRLINKIREGKTEDKKTQVYSGEYFMKKEYDGAAIYLPL